MVQTNFRNTFRNDGALRWLADYYGSSGRELTGFTSPHRQGLEPGVGDPGLGRGVYADSSLMAVVQALADLWRDRAAPNPGNEPAATSPEGTALMARIHTFLNGMNAGSGPPQNPPQSFPSQRNTVSGWGGSPGFWDSLNRQGDAPPQGAPADMKPRSGPSVQRRF